MHLRLIYRNFDKLSISPETYPKVKFTQDQGMVCNPTKTDFIVFGCPGPPCSMIVGDGYIRSKDNITVLGVTFEKSLRWSTHVSNVIKKANSTTYSLRMLNLILPRSLHRQVIHSHFLSHLTYASPVWAGCLKVAEIRRMNALVFKVLRQHCFDYTRNLSNRELCVKSNIRSFTSLRIINDTIMLHGLCRNPTNLDLTIRLIQQSFSLPRYPDKLYFFDASQKRIGRSSFVNRSKQISELIPFAWPDIDVNVFKARIKSTVPLYMP